MHGEGPKIHDRRYKEITKILVDVGGPKTLPKESTQLRVIPIEDEGDK